MSNINEQDIILNIEMSVAEVNVVLRSLGKHPFEEIAALIQKIKQQGEIQLAELKAGSAEEDLEQLEESQEAK